MRAARGLVGDLSSAFFAGNDGHGTMPIDRSKAQPQRDGHELCLTVVGQNSQITRLHEERRSIGDCDLHPNSGVPGIVPAAGRALLGCYGGKIARLAIEVAANDAAYVRYLSQHGLLAIPACAAKQIYLRRG